MTPLEKPTYKKLKKLSTEIGNKFKPQKVILSGDLHPVIVPLSKLEPGSFLSPCELVYTRKF